MDIPVVVRRAKRPRRSIHSLITRVECSTALSIGYLEPASLYKPIKDSLIVLNLIKEVSNK
uniref:Uncharacterized protein n=1 Tax=uncultured marine virus TaxID=186617 RepID=A0A0F7L6T3_9VIRU|nr:hypothetical protein [uncultured marine virus]